MPSISHGTLRTQDLLSAFADELMRIDHPKYAKIIEEAVTESCEINADYSRNIDYAQNLLEDMSMILESYAPDGHYFGAHEGDGSDFGYWPIDSEALDDAVNYVRYDIALERELAKPWEPMEAWRMQISPRN